MPIDGTVFEANNLGDLPGIRHGFFSRQGGVSGGVYGSLNCGYGSQDQPEAVRENRRRVAEHLLAGTDANCRAGTQHDDVVTVYQVHSAKAVVVGGPFAEGTTPKADAVVCATRGVVVGALAADCTPVLFADPVNGVVAAAHAGWRGAVDGVLQATVDAMEALGGHRKSIHAAVGPTIHQAAYEVGPEFEAEFIRRANDNGRFFTRPSPGGRPHFDLPGYCRHQLTSSGVASVTSIGQCTYENESMLFSYRRKTHLNEPDYGRQISAIVLY
ncbi:MAG TPA: peptidoglycan editing factor PgeF [Hyphomicrobiaceae bacterium]|nr:peptidoglycan editing factor PgeF [Hyphomicrobiaceae bacterium]